MFVGLSKNLGGGFRLGIGTRINLNQNNNNNKSSKKDEQEEEFIKFINSMNEKSLNSIKKFIENSGYDFNKLSNYDIDLDELFVGNKKYEEFSKLVIEASKIITRTMEIKDYGVVAKRRISDKVYELVDFEEDYSKNFNTYLEQGLTTPSKEIDFSKYTFTNPMGIKKQENSSKEKDISIFYKIFIYLGVLVMPLIFAWFTLKKGFSTTSRVLAFIWFIFFLASLGNMSKTDNLNNTNTTPTTTNQEVKTK